MRVRCLYSTGAALKAYEYQYLDPLMMGRFGATGVTEYNELDIGKDYLVMGLIVFETYQGYLIDESGLISVFPCQLFEIVDNTVNPNWKYRTVEHEENCYPFLQAIFGYPELIYDKNAYENLIVEMDEAARMIYFKRKIELENKLME